eukprot:GEMP01062496.1.p1 GENE.GEMP01062496.1~~GEMP01062496.1.p1  ORF type:complete len:314 (+),score=70.75 GEMP01062496.1:415-1356(+)
MRRSHSQVELAKHPGARKGSFYSPQEVEEDFLNVPADVAIYREKLSEITMTLHEYFNQREAREEKRRQHEKEIRNETDALRKAPYFKRQLEARPRFRAQDQCLRSISEPNIDYCAPAHQGYKWKGSNHKQCFLGHPHGVCHMSSSKKWASAQKSADDEGHLPEGVQKYRDRVAKNVKRWKMEMASDVEHATTGHLKRQAMMEQLKEKSPFSVLVREKPPWDPTESVLRVFHPDMRPISSSEPYLQDYQDYITSPTKALDYSPGVTVARGGATTHWKQPASRKNLGTNVAKVQKFFNRRPTISMEVRSEMVVIT